MTELVTIVSFRERTPEW